MRFFPSLIIFASAWLALGAAAQERVMNIYLEPDMNGTVYFQESMKNLNKYEPRPVLDGKGAGGGWMFVHFPGRYVGYVQDTQLGPTGSTVRNGAKAYLRPDLSSPVLAVILDGSKAEVARREGNWAVVYFNGKAPAYFRAESEGPPSPVTTAPAPTRGQPSSPPPAQSSAPVLEEVVMEEAVLPIAPVSAGSAPLPQSVARYVQGTMKRVSAWDRLWGSDYKYRLVDSDGDTLAYLNLDDTLMIGSIDAYWDQPVEVTGVVKKIPGSVPFVIEAGNIRVLH